MVGVSGVILKILLTRPSEVADNNLAGTIWFGFITKMHLPTSWRTWVCTKVTLVVA